MLKTRGQERTLWDILAQSMINRITDLNKSEKQVEESALGVERSSEAVLLTGALPFPVSLPVIISV